MMKRFFLIIILICATQFSFAQATKDTTKSDIGKISLSIVLPETLEGLDASQLSKIQSKVVQIVTANGLGGSSLSSTFVIYPKFAINDSSVAEGGMEAITLVSCEFSLYIKETENNVLYSSISKTLKGSGKNQQTALNNSINQISTGDAIWKTFIETGKNKIIQYYESKTDDLLKKADGLIKTEKFEDAIALLLTVPEEIPSCYQKVQAKAIEAFKAMKENQGTKLLALAKIAFEKEDFTGGLNQIQLIAPSTNAYTEAQNLIKSYKDKLAQILLANAKIEFDKGNFHQSLDLIKKIDPSSASYAEAVPLIKVYKEKLNNQLLANAKIEFERGDFEQGLSTVQKIEAESPCFKEGEQLIKVNQEKFCKQLITKARSAFALKDYAGATQYLNNVNPDTSCFSDAQKIIKEIDAKITAEEKREIANRQREIANEMQLKRDALSAMKDIAIERAKNQPSTVNYIGIIK